MEVELSMTNTTSERGKHWFVVAVVVGEVVGVVTVVGVVVGVVVGDEV